MRHDNVPPQSRVFTAPTLRVYGNHGRDHWFPGNVFEDCRGCQPWLSAPPSLAEDAWLADRRRHPSNTPSNVAYWDQVAAREREEAAAGGRALTCVVGVLAWVLFIALGVAGIAADVPTAITVLCCAVMFALLPLMFPRKAKP